MDKLIEKIIKTKNPTVAGLDPKLSFIPNFIKEAAFEEYGHTLNGAAHALLQFNIGLIDALCDVVPAIKPQAAYYEMYGFEGMRTLHHTIKYAKEKGMYVITDGKRNDIGTTMEAYAAAHLGKVTVGENQFAPFDGDALTVNGYLGTDGIAPLIPICNEYDRSIFVLVKTSNPSSGQLQDVLVGEKHVYEIMGEMCENWGADNIMQHGYSRVGAVVGATYKNQLEELRAKMPHTFFLVPGYGAQGGGAKDVSYAFDKNGIGAIVNSSRGIMCAYQNENCDEKQFAEAALREAIRMRDDITQYINC